jgi:hypothetical protein
MRWVVIVGVLLAACASPGVPPSVSVYQTRSDMPLDKIEIQVRNNDEGPLTVQRAELVSSRFVDTAVWDETVEIPAGAAIDLKVQMPEASCVEDPVDEVVLTLRTGQITLVPEDPLDQLDKYSQDRCFAREVAATARLDVRGLRGDALLVEVDPGQAEVGRIGTTVLFRPRDPVLSEGLQRVRLRPNRCDAHAVAEDKQGTYFPVRVSLPDGRTGDVTVQVDRRTRQGLYRLYARQCGLT